MGSIKFFELQSSGFESKNEVREWLESHIKELSWWFPSATPYIKYKIQNDIYVYGDVLRQMDLELTGHLTQDDGTGDSLGIEVGKMSLKDENSVNS